MSDSVVKTLLSSKKWSEEDLLASLTDKRCDEFIAKVNLLERKYKRQDVACAVCSKDLTQMVCIGFWGFCAYAHFEKHSKANIIQLPRLYFVKDSVASKCGHEYCSDCCGAHLTKKIMDENVYESIDCPVAVCDKIVDIESIVHVITTEDVRQKYEYFMANSFVRVSCTVYIQKMIHL